MGDSEDIMGESDTVGKPKDRNKPTDGNLVFLIEEIWTDCMENRSSDAVGYEPYGFTPDKDVAKRFCAQGREYTHEDCWAISHPMPEYRYKPLKRVE